MPRVGTTENRSAPLSTTIRSTPSRRPPRSLRLLTDQGAVAATPSWAASTARSSTQTSCDTSVSTNVGISSIAFSMRFVSAGPGCRDGVSGEIAGLTSTASRDDPMPEPSRCTGPRLPARAGISFRSRFYGPMRAESRSCPPRPGISVRFGTSIAIKIIPRGPEHILRWPNDGPISGVGPVSAGGHGGRWGRGQIGFDITVPPAGSGCARPALTRAGPHGRPEQIKGDQPC